MEALLKRMGMWYHWQNLNEKGKGVKGSGLFHGRAWLHLRGEGSRDRSIGFEWCLGRYSRHCSIGFCVGGEETDFSFNVCLPYLLSLYVNLAVLKVGSRLECMLPRRLCSYTHPTEGPREFTHRIHKRTELSIHNGALWWNFWNYDDESSSTDPWWQHGAWYPMDTLWGRRQHSKREIDRRDGVVVPMPEGNYHADVVFEEAIWKRPRWPFPLKRVTATVSVLEEGGIPVPGKGTAAYNCGPNAIYSLSCVATTVHEAVSQLVKSALHDRERYPL